MIEVKQFTGAIDTDSANENISPGSVRMCTNMEWYGPIENLRPQSIVGTTLVPNALLPVTGTNSCIGRFYDAVKHRLFYFNYNSSGNHVIFIYNTIQGTFQSLVANGTTTNGDVLGFTSDIRIHSVGIIYGDPSQGDLLFFVDSLQRLRKLNILRFLSGTYNTSGQLIQTNYLSLIKAPFFPPIQCCYENDFTVAANECINSLFLFCCTPIYDDYEEAVMSTACRQPLPSDTFDLINNVSIFRNARIGLYVPTGDQNVIKIRIYGKQVTGGSTSDWFIVQDLIKADLSIANNTWYKYLFYNNGTYIAANPSFAVLDYDYVPQKVNTLEIINGNTLAIAGATEGYDFFNPTFQIATSNQTAQTYVQNGVLFFAATNGIFSGSQPQINIYLTGVGTNDGLGNPLTVEKIPQLLKVRAKTGSTDISFSFNNSTGFAAIAQLLSGLSTAAASAGWTVVATHTNYITCYYPTGNVVLQSSFIDGLFNDTSPYPSSVSAMLPQASYAWGALYQDGDGKNNGVISNLTGNIATQAIGAPGQIPQALLNLSGTTPPTWAKTWELVRSDNLTYGKYFHWISNAACQGTGGGVSTQYAYFGISNIFTYNQSINATEGVVSYGFSPGDRINVVARYDRNMTRTTLNYTYPVLGVVVNPIANGIRQIGTFVQIYYPGGDIGSNFQFVQSTIDTDYQNYEVIIISFKTYLPSNENVFFRIGQQYGIGNPGTPGAYHMGNIADNQVVLTDGDVFYRKRNIPLQNQYFIQCASYDQASTYSTDWVNPGGGGTPIVNNGIWELIGGMHLVAGLLGTQYPNYSNNDCTFANLSTTQVIAVRLKGSQVILDKTDPNGTFEKYAKVVMPGNVVQLTQIVPLIGGLQPSSNSTTAPQTVEWDVTIQVPPQGRLWLINYCVNEFLISGYRLEVDVIRTITINVFDYSFSDIYNLKTNSDNKPNVITTQALTTYYPTLFRFSQAYLPSTNLNNTNRFYPNNYTVFPQSHGDVRRMYAWGQKLRIFHDRKIGEVGVYFQFVSTDGIQLIKNQDIIEKNNIQYFEYNGGIGNQPSSLISSGYQNYLPDPVTGKWLRVSLDGVKDISEEFMSQTLAGKLILPYQSNYNYQFGGNAVILGTYNVKQNKEAEILFVFQAGTNGSTSIPGLTVAFNERKNSFTGVYNISPDDIICCENNLYSFYNGNLYVHNNTTNYCNFYGTQYYPSIQMIFNTQPIIKKNFMAVGYQSAMNKKWGAINVGDILTSFVNPQSNRQQISQLPADNFTNEEGSIVAALKRDANAGTNAQYSVNEGDPLLGFWLEMTLTAPDNQFDFIYLPFVKWEASQKTP